MTGPVLPIAHQERRFYASLIRSGVPLGRAIVACWDRERSRWRHPAILPLPHSRGLAAWAPVRERQE